MTDSPDRLAQLSQARREGMLLHALPVDLLVWLADHHDIYPTEVVPHPGTFFEHLERRDTERALGKIAANCDEQMRDVPGFELDVAAGRLGIRATELFGTITDITSENVHADELRTRRGHVVDGRGIADTVTLGSRSHLEALQLSHLLGGMLHNTERYRPVTPGHPQRVGEQPTLPAITIPYFTEHDARSVDRARWSLLWRELTARGLYVSPHKRTLQQLEESGHIFRANVFALFWHAKDAYQNTPATASYAPTGTRNAPKQDVPFSRYITTDIPAFKRLRDTFNVVIRPLRDGKHRNPEQDPVVARRPTIERGVHLQRRRATRESVADGPPTPHVTPAIKVASSELIRSVREHPDRAIFNSLAWVAGKVIGGVSDLLASPIAYIPAAYRSGKHLTSDIRSWHRQRHEAIAAGRALDDLVTRLMDERRV